MVDTEAVAGGGSLPGLTIPSCGVSLEVSDADAALAALRASGIVARVDAGAIVCDLRTVDPSDDPRLAAALAEDRRTWRSAPGRRHCPEPAFRSVVLRRQSATI